MCIESSGVQGLVFRSRGYDSVAVQNYTDRLREREKEWNSHIICEQSWCFLPCPSIKQAAERAHAERGLCA